MRVFYTFQVCYWTGSYNKPGSIFATLAEAQSALGHSRNGCIYKIRNVTEA